MQFAIAAAARLQQPQKEEKEEKAAADATCLKATLHLKHGIAHIMQRNRDTPSDLRRLY